MMSLWDALRMNMMISYQELVRTFPNIELGNDPIIGIEAYPGTAEIHAKMGYKVIPGDENAPLKRMTLQPSSLPDLFELKNGEWNYMVMLPTY
ncbi:DUF2686 family protein, partial [Escherichia coli]|uniref:DUF2686 family protein n=2 Tax=Escherichia coli TaxID=562 RepID=UPI00200BD64D